MQRALQLVLPYLLFVSLFCFTFPLQGQDSERLYLSGTGPEDAVAWEFRIENGRRSGEEATLPVPSQWELHGFGELTYGFHEEPSDEVGHYRHRFEVPEGWRGRRVELVFEGAMTDALVHVNGRQAGPEHRGGFTPFTYEVSELLRYGEENLLGVRLREDSAEVSINKAERHADYWVFGGIYRPVYLEAHPAASISHLGVDARHDGSLTLSVELLGFSGSGELRGRIRPWAASGEPLAAVAELSPILLRGEPSYLTTREQIDGIQAWNAESPKLYLLELELWREDELQHRRQLRFGFRTVELRQGDGIYVNGRRVLLRGISRHSFSPFSGRSVTPELNRLDAELIRGMNANAVRTSHYPPDRAFLEACDEVGLYVIDELPGWHDAYSTEAGRPLVREMVRRDAHHPSILFWANGNEEGWNRELDGDFHLWDPQKRPVLHPDSNLDGIDSVHYPSWEELRQRVEIGPLRSRLLAPFQPLPLLMPTELLHGLYDGGHGAGLEEYWNAIRTLPRGAGMFLWTFLDEGVLRADQDGFIDTHTNYGADGIVGPRREKEGSYFTVRELWSPVQVLAAELRAEGGRVELENRYHHTDLSQVRFRWQWLSFPGAASVDRGATLWPGDEVAGPAAAPGERAALRIPAPPMSMDEALGPAGELSPDSSEALTSAPAPPPGAPAHFSPSLALRLTALDPLGREILTWTLPADGAPSSPTTRTGHAAEPVRVQKPGGRLRLRTGELALHIDPTNGRLLLLERGDRTFSLGAGPRRADGVEAELLEYELSGEEGSQIFEATYRGGLDRVRWQLFPSGWIRLDFAYSVDRQSELFGIGFSYPQEKVLELLRFGRGPSRVWKNRLAGGRLDLWRSTPNSGNTGEVWEYPEWSGFFAGTRWADLHTQEGRLTLVLDSSVPYLGLYQVPYPEEPRGAQAPNPETDLSLLHGIPGIGGKFHTAAELGPAGAAYPAQGRLEGSLWLYLHSDPVYPDAVGTETAPSDTVHPDTSAD